MNSTLKPILDQIEQIKTKFNDPEFRAKVAENFQQTKTTVESRAKDVLSQARDSKFVNEYVVPLLESEKTEQALNKLKDRFGQTQLFATIENVRQQIIDSKVAAAKPVESAEQTVAAAAPAAEQTEKH